jgi:hypothetical protein
MFYGLNFFLLIAFAVFLAGKERRICGLCKKYDINLHLGRAGREPDTVPQQKFVESA